MQDESTYPFQNLNGATVEVWKWISIFILHTNWARDYLYMLVSKLTHACK